MDHSRERSPSPGESKSKMPSWIRGDAPSPTEKKGKRDKKVTYIGYKVGDISFAAITPRLPDRMVPSVEEENRSLKAQGLQLGEDVEQGIVRALSPTSEYNCHGWVFLEGEAWLDDNKFIIDKLIKIGKFMSVDISGRKSGDIALYRNMSTGEITHSALVYDSCQSGDGNKPVFVSKWAEGSLFHHYSDNVPSSYYNDEVTIEIYRAPEGWTKLSPTIKIPMIRRSTSEDVINRMASVKSS